MSRGKVGGDQAELGMFHDDYPYSIRVYYRDTHRFRTVLSGYCLEQLEEICRREYRTEKHIFVERSWIAIECENEFHIWEPDKSENWELSQTESSVELQIGEQIA